MEKSVLHKAAEKRIVSISINTLMLLSIVGVFCTIKSENKFTQPKLWQLVDILWELGYTLDY